MNTFMPIVMERMFVVTDSCSNRFSSKEFYMEKIHFCCTGIFVETGCNVINTVLEVVVI